MTEWNSSMFQHLLALFFFFQVTSTTEDIKIEIFRKHLPLGYQAIYCVASGVLCNNKP